MATHRQRIYALADQGKITSGQQQELLARERHDRGALDLVRTKLGEDFSDFRARAYAVARCRGRQHWWDENYPHVLPYRPIGAVYTESALCVRCGKIRVTLVNAIGHTDRQVYIDPPGFALEGVKTTKADWKALTRYIELGMLLDRLEQEDGDEDAGETNVVPLDAHRIA